MSLEFGSLRERGREGEVERERGGGVHYDILIMCMITLLIHSVIFSLFCICLGKELIIHAPVLHQSCGRDNNMVVAMKPRQQAPPTSLCEKHTGQR